MNKCLNCGKEFDPGDGNRKKNCSPRCARDWPWNRRNKDVVNKNGNGDYINRG